MIRLPYLTHPLFPLLGLLLWLVSCAQEESGLVRRTQFIMGTLVEITVAGVDQDKANAAISIAFDEMSRLERLMSTYMSDSEISRINRAAGGDWVSVSPEVLEVIQRGIYRGEQSKGALDISIGPVVNLWGFDEEEKHLPHPARLEEAIALVDFRVIEIRDHNVRLANPGMKLRLGALAKGYAVDRAAQTLQDAGIENALVNAGGDLMVIGTRGNDRPWRIGLQHPRKPEDMMATFALKNQAVATSGDYQKYFIFNGVRYHHILDPVTGQPARGTISATVITERVMDADALATAVFVLGPERGMDLIESLDGTEAMWISESGSALFSSGFRNQPEFQFEDIKNDLRD